ncbi:WD40 repeat domain-containing protein [Actinomadura miaoliensis]|uniref:HEAT repeat domain-containing protein n=1 Tax=Actinomadura miaoliensis TaxID=430685 RepID=A0ABP7WXR8_9ACTN
MTGIVDYGRFAERLRQVMPRWDERTRMSEEEFAEHLADTGPRWELLRQFQEEWGYVPLEDDTVWPRWSEDEHKAYVRRLSGRTGDDDRFADVDLTLPIPKALDEWWDLPFNSFTHRPRLYWTNPLWPPTVRPDPTGYGASDGLPEDNPYVGPGGDRRVCVLMAENQYCNEWGYLAAEAGMADPRVFVSVEKGWVEQSRSVSEFFLQLAVERLPEHFGWTLPLGEEDFGADEAEMARRVRERFPELGLLPWRELGARTYAYGAPDAIIRYNAGEYHDAPLHIHARTRAALRRVADTLGIDLREERIAAPDSEDARLDIGPVSISAGDTDDRGRWTARQVSPERPEHAEISFGRLTGDAEPPGLTVTALDSEAVTLVAGDRDGGVHARLLDADPPHALHHALHKGAITAVTSMRTLTGAPVMWSGDDKGVVRIWGSNVDPRDTPYDVRRRNRVTALHAESLPTGPAVAIAWSDGLVRIWDVFTLLAADLELGSGIDHLVLRPDATLVVGGDHGTVTLQLHPERLWPTHELTVRLGKVDWESLATSRDRDASGIPDLILRAATANADYAERTVEALASRLLEKDAPCSAAGPAAPLLLDVAAAPGCEARAGLLELLARIVGAPTADRSAAQARAAAASRRPTLLALLDDPDPAVRAAAATVIEAADLDTVRSNPHPT